MFSDVAAASQPRENKAAGEGYAEDVFSPLREGRSYSWTGLQISA